MSRTSVATLIGRELRALRETAALRQDQVAATARAWGFLDWTSATVAAVEAGRRQLSVEELVLMPWIINGTGPASAVSHPDHSGATELPQILGCDHRAVVEITPMLALTGAGFQAIFAGRADTDAMVRAVLRAPKSKSVRLEAGLDAELKAARKLGIAAADVVTLSRRLWGRSLTEERDRRVSEAAHAPRTARALQAQRGHMTRSLVAELGVALKKGAKRT